jgi:hypothetical protein
MTGQPERKKESKETGSIAGVGRTETRGGESMCEYVNICVQTQQNLAYVNIYGYDVCAYFACLLTLHAHVWREEGREEG